ncbi:MAG TPA: permease-like cell division protein FtsX [Methylomirabilota bacterium]
MLLSALAVLVAGATLAGDLALGLSEAAWRADLRLVVVLREAGARPEAADGLVARARALPGVAELRYVGPAVALAELRRLLGPRGEGLDRLPSNPLPPRLEVTPAATLGAEDLQALAAALDRLPGVTEVQTAFDWVEPLARLRRGLRLGGLALAGALGVAALAAASGATVAARRVGAEEASVLRLAGVPPLRLAVPPVLQAVALATLGSLLGLSLLLLASEPGAPWAGSWLRAVLGLDPLPLLPSSWLASLTGAGAALGLVGALAAGRA